MHRSSLAVAPHGAGYLCHIENFTRTT